MLDPVAATLYPLTLFDALLTKKHLQSLVR